MTERGVVIIGAGLGGLACALALAGAGVPVTVVERAAATGGKMREVAAGGARIDAGPTVMTMRWVFDALFAAVGARLDDHVRLTPLAVLARHAWTLDQTLDLFAEAARSEAAIGALAGPAAAAGFRAFSREAAAIHDTLRDTFLDAQVCGPVGLSQRIGLRRAGALFGLRPFETLWNALCDHFADPRLRQLFGRYATYCGSSPFRAPATLMLIAHVEQAGVWAIEGGMRRLAAAMEQLARSLGVVIRLDTEAAEIETANGRASGVRLADGERLAAQAVVVNADAGALAAGLFGAEAARAVPPLPTAARSLSAVTWAFRAPTGGFPLRRHNVFFSADYAAEFEDILVRGRAPAGPTVYVCAQDRDGAQGPGPTAAGERLLVLMNAPPNGDEAPWGRREVEACEATVFEHLRRLGLETAPPPETVVTTPADFAALFPGTGGALYGRATHGWSAAFSRPGAATRMPGLYLAGGGAHPGAGAPMAALSGRLAARRLMADRASTRRFRPGATSGGTSTPSATTAGTA